MKSSPLGHTVAMGPLVHELGATLHAELTRFLPDVHQDTRDRLVAQAIVQPFHRGDILSRQGDPLGVTLILSGFIATRSMGLGGQSLTLGICGTGYAPRSCACSRQAEHGRSRRPR